MNRLIRIEGDIAYVPLTQGHEAVIDAADVPLVDGFNWCARVVPNTVYAVRTDRLGAKPREVSLHRVLMGDPDGLEVDHRDRNGLNCRRQNLRAATHAQNAMNRAVQSNNTSGFKGVSWHKAKGKWRAEIKVGGKKRHLGSFHAPEDAHAAYCKASTELHGDFGRTG